MATRTRKKKDAEVAGAFTVGEEAPKSTEDERPPISEETVDGLLDLRGHLEQKVPRGLAWPFDHASMQQHLSDIDSAAEAVDKLAVRHAMSREKLGELRRFLEADAYAMGYLICRHRAMVPEVHMAMCYAAAGQAQKLAWFLTQTGFEGYVIDHFREACKARDINLSSRAGIEKLDAALDWQNHRWPRGVFKSSAITHVGVVSEATKDPDNTILITSAIEDKAFEMVGQAGETLTSGIYRDIFPDRVPVSSRDVKKDWIRVNGRTISHRQTTIQGASYISREIGGHYCKYFTDDLMVRDMRTGEIYGYDGGIRWLHGMRGLFMLTRRIRRIHAGTCNGDEDDHSWLSKPSRRKRCMSIFIPAETYEKMPDSVFVRGEPTMPTFFTPERIEQALADTVGDESEYDGVEAYRCDFWLSPTPGKAKPLIAAIVNDPSRCWLGPYEHPKKKLQHQRINYAARFMIAKVERDETGAPLDRETRKPLDASADGWQSRAAVPAFDPWEDMDRVLTLHPTWRDGGRLWALTAAAIDPQLVKFQLETRAGDGGMEQWIPELVSMAKTYDPRVIGIDRYAYHDPIVQNAFDTDPRLQPLKRRITSVDQSDTNEEARIRAGVAEPLKSYRLLLLPKSEDDRGDFGAAITRREMLRYRAGSDQPWPVLDSLAMIDSIMIKVATREERERMARKFKSDAERYRASVHPALGVPVS